MGNAEGCSVGGCFVGSLALLYLRSEGAVLAAMGVCLLALVDVEIVPKIDWVNENARGTP